MVRPPTELGSLRFSRLERERLLLALLFSLLVHLAVWGGYEAEKKNGWLKKLFPSAKHKLVMPPPPVVQNIDPTIFLDVSQASADAPKQAKYYSDKNSHAANPDAKVDSNQPKLDGKQHDVPKLEDAPRPTKAKPVTPQPPQKPVEQKPAQATKPATALNPGALQPGKPADTAKPDEKATPPERPRTLKEALAQSKQLPGLQLQQDGGVKRRALTSSLDAMATPFGAYDRAIVEAISQRWYDLLDSQSFADSRSGKVTVTFHLNPDGSVTELKSTLNTVGDVLGYICQEAIQQAAPFGKWPSDMRRMIGANFREITFTFYYY
jgi:outer membrane biosynthesis protein TonB